MTRVQAVNESTWIIYLGDMISDEVAARVAQVIEKIRTDLGFCLVDIIPSYTSVMVSFDLRQVDRFFVGSNLKKIVNLAQIQTGDTQENHEVVLPVYYGSETALDIDFIAQDCHMSTEDVIRLHSEQRYRVYAIGFSPGFAYLGNTPDKLRVARKATPRLKVPAGSLGIADNQTAIYPTQTPGGWQIIGRTPLNMIDWNSDTLTRVKVGDWVRFEPVDRVTFLKLGGVLDEL